MKLCQILMANFLLRRYIEVLIILKLELLQKSDTAKPFRAQIIIGFEPSSIFDFFDLFQPSAVIDATPLQGMLQIHQILPEHVDMGNLSKIDTFPESLWENLRMESSLSGLPYGVIQFMYGSGNVVAVNTMDVVIQIESMDLARQANELEIPNPFQAGSTIKKPLSEHSCMELINALIRQDTKNKWLLRINMAANHKKLLKDTSLTFPDYLERSGSVAADNVCGFSEALSAKLVQESIYSEYIQASIGDC